MIAHRAGYLPLIKSGQYNDQTSQDQIGPQSGGCEYPMSSHWMDTLCNWLHELFADWSYVLHLDVKDYAFKI